VTAAQTVFHQQRHLLRQREGDFGGEVGGLAEVDEVLEGEGKGNGFGEVDGDVLLGLVDAGVLTDGDGSTANVALAGELDTLLRGLNDDY
jgi:hypothetical protein